MGDDTTHWEGLGKIPPQVGMQADRTKTSDRAVQWMSVDPLAEAIVGAGLQEADTYIFRRQNTAVQFIATRIIIELYMVVEWHLGSGVDKW